MSHVTMYVATSLPLLLLVQIIKGDGAYDSWMAVRYVLTCPSPAANPPSTLRDCPKTTRPYYPLHCGISTLRMSPAACLIHSLFPFP
ncbi:hypothetical protein BDZ97DRAFT_1809630 [Flammula alnicola]|nr:hypothetical protein BDZ97DRAFT_1809630 [Flammula alnicola]